MRALAAILTLAITFTARIGYAEATPALELSSNGRLETAHRIDAQRRAAVAMMATGIVMTVAAIAMTCVGTYRLMQSLGSDDTNTQDRYFKQGAPTLAVGQALGIAGVPLWVIGQNKLAKAERARVRISASGVYGVF